MFNIKKELVFNGYIRTTIHPATSNVPTISSYNQAINLICQCFIYNKIIVKKE